MDTTITYSDPNIRYPVTKELDGDRLFATCATILSKLEGVQYDLDCPGFELFYTGTSGVGVATALAAMNRARTATMNLAFAQVAKNDDPAANHRSTIETTHPRGEKEGFLNVFVDDFIVTGDTFNRTKRTVESMSSERGNQIRPGFVYFDGLILFAGVPCELMRDRAKFVIRPEES